MTVCPRAVMGRRADRFKTYYGLVKYNKFMFLGSSRDMGSGARVRRINWNSDQEALRPPDAIWHSAELSTAFSLAGHTGERVTGQGPREGLFSKGPQA